VRREAPAPRRFGISLTSDSAAVKKAKDLTAAAAYALSAELKAASPHFVRCRTHSKTPEKIVAH